MKQTPIFLILLFMLITPSVHSQNYYKEWHKHYLTTTIGGGNNLRSEIDRKTIPGTVISHRNSSVFSFRYTFAPFKHWGAYIESGIRISHNASDSIFLVSQTEEGQYYIRENFSGKFDNELSLSLGITYRWENKHFCLLPYTGIEVANDISTYASYILKERDTNNLYRITYNEQKYYNEGSACLYFAGGAALHYKLTQRFHFLMDVSYRHPFNRTKIEYQKVDLYTDKVIEEKELKATAGRYVNIKIGLSYAIW